MLQKLSSGRINAIILTLLALYPLVGMGVDLIAPSLPAIAQELKISDHLAKNLISIYLLGYAVGNLLLGILADALGRRRLLLSGFLLLGGCSLLPPFFPHIYVLLAARFMQGIAIAALSVLARVIFADILPKERLAITITWVSTMWGIGPIIGPFIGGYLQDCFNWSAGFYFFAGFSFLAYILLYFILPETLPDRKNFSLGIVKNNFIAILTHKVFMGVILIVGIAYALLIVFNVLGPFFVQKILGKTAVYYGNLALWMGMGYLIGTVICRKLLQAFTPSKLLWNASLFVFITALIMLMLNLMDNKSLTFVVVPSFLIFVASGILFPSGISRCLTLFQHLAGSAASTMGFINVIITTLAASSISLIEIKTSIPISLLYLFLAFICLMSYKLLIKEK